ncbi:hypothetical protein RI367_001102 [Sorochytrium milnesiophthora]
MSNLSDDPAIKARLTELTSLSLTTSFTDVEGGTLSPDALLDTLTGIYREVKAGDVKNKYTQKFLEKFEPLLTSMLSLRLNVSDFDVVKDLAKGAFGRVQDICMFRDGGAHEPTHSVCIQVSLVRNTSTKQLYALKSLKKAQAIGGQEASLTPSLAKERRVMASIDSQWIIRLHASFQDEQHLYLVMEYAPGGDLCRVLEEQGLLEDEARFYIAQTICAIEELHKAGYVHRDVKPHNLLIDKTGHIKLADFGSCIRLNEKEQVTSVVSVGTPDYIAPEVLRAQEGKSSYGKQCDWWSLGIVLYETLFAETPFYNDSMTYTYAMILEHKKHLRFPPDGDVSEQAIDLVKKLLTEQEERLGRNGPDEVKGHPWFSGIDWSSVRAMPPPFVPELSSDSDTRYFPDLEDDEPEIAYKERDKRDNAMSFLPFVGYTYLRGHQYAPAATQTSGQQAPASLAVPSATTASSTPATTLARRDSHANHTAKLEAAMRQKIVECDELMTQLTSKERQIEENKATIGELNERITHQEGKLKSAAARELVYATADKEKAAVEQERQQLRAKVEAVELDKTELQKQLNSLKYAAEKEARHVAALADDIKRLEDGKTRCEKDLTSAREELKSQNALSSMQRLRVSELSKEKTLLELEIDSLRQRVSAEAEEVQLTRGKIDSRIEELEKARNALTIQISELSEKNRQQTEDAVALKSTVAALEQSLRDTQQEATNQQRARSAAEQARDEARKSSQALSEQIETLSAEVQKLKRELDQEQRAAQQREVELLDFKQIALNDVEENCRKMLDMEQALYHRDCLIVELNASAQEAKDLQSEMAHLRAERDTLDKSLALYMQHASLQSSSDKSDKRLKHENRELKALIVSKDSRITELEREIGELKTAREQVSSRQSISSLTTSPTATPASPTIREPPGGVPESPTGAVGLTRKATIGLFFGRKRSRPNLKLEKDSTGAYYRGYLKVVAQPDKGIKHGWKKKYVAIKDNQVLLFEKEKDYLGSDSGVLLFTLTAEIFLARSPHYDDIHHANKSDKPLIFAVTACTSVLDHVRELTRKVEIEESYREAAKKLTNNAFSPAQQKESQNQLQECNSNLARLMLELEFYKTLAYMRDVSSTEAEGLLKYQARGVPGEGRGIETPRELSDRRPSVFEPMRNATEGEWNEEAEKLRNLHIGEVHECNGHRLRGEQFTKAISCHHCGDTLFGNRTSGLQCEGCHFACHRTCLSYLFQYRCSQMKVLQGAKHTYFLADNIDEKKSWLAIIQTLRKQYETYRLVGSGVNGAASSLSIPSSVTSVATANTASESPKKLSVPSI